jgi:predicted ATPase
MLTRLKVSGFKNLVDVDVQFGPFTCIAGPNGVGKSNLFDAIRFLSALADRPLLDAALSVRDEGGKAADIRNLFHRVGETYADTMSFEAEMLIPRNTLDDLGQKAEASITFLRYSLTLAYRQGEIHLALGSLELRKEELVHINRSDARKHLPFDHHRQWRESVVQGKRAGGAFISTEEVGAERIVKLHQDGKGGRTLKRQAASLPRTVLSAANAAESPTVLVAQKEMQSWQLLQLEPSALRQPDEFTTIAHLAMNGAHLPSTLYRVARSGNHAETNGNPHNEAGAHIYGQVANRLAELIDDVHTLWIERDEKRELLTLYVQSRDGTPYPARALSDGTLRFLALAVLELDPQTQGLLCLEEPENGVHPERIPAMLKLLQDIATDLDEPVGPDNPLRQVIINTHSPAVVCQVPDACLLVAESQEYIADGRRFKRVCFNPLPDTWRAKSHEQGYPVSKGKLLAYLNPTPSEPSVAEFITMGKHGSSKR